MPWAAVAAVAAGVGAVTSTAGIVEQGNAQTQQAKFQAQVAQNNAQVAQQNANYAIQAGDVQATAQGQKNRAQIGSIKAKQASNNLDVNSGSAVKVRAGASETGMQNVLQTKQNALRQAYGYQSQATGYQAESGLENYAASTIPIGTALSATGNFFNDASTLPTKWGGGGGGGTPDAYAGNDSIGGMIAANP